MDSKYLFAEDYDLHRGIGDDALDFWVRFIRKHVRIEQSSSIMDLGCGTGIISLSLLRSTHANLIGFDLSNEMLSIAKKKDESKEIIWHRGDAQALPFQDNSFDLILMSLAFHQIRDKPKVLRDCFCLLRPRGSLLIRTISHKQLKMSIINKFFPPALEIDLKRFPDIDALKTESLQLGFKDVKDYDLGEFPEESVSGKKVPPKEMIIKVEKKYVSTLNLIPTDEFNSGLKKLKEYLKNQDNELIDYSTTVIVARKAERAS